ncbi:MAG: TGS domain-containing protein [Euryarchaeota archaeon]|jgi:ribosome-binding ATPase YchF (GTP1/OBG family)|nr:TGS domain-containing protein [Euryarchaeota archaeon]MDG1545918.1 50S ribosome-binding GTPase [Candidatus Poseidoniaceae archaeon]
MRIGLVGKPNVGKSTFFSAATLAKVDIANYPFCTIEPNVGVAFIEARKPCPCKDIRQRLESEGRLQPISDEDQRQGSICQPRTGSCVGFRRLVPCFLVDVAGLVPGASEGKGRGNAFLSDLANSDALIQVVDAAGSTDIEGNPIGAGQTKEDAQLRINQEIEFLANELDAWISGILMDGWQRGVRRVQAEGEKGLVSFIHERLTGLGANLNTVANAYDEFKNEVGDCGQPWNWQDEIINKLAIRVRIALFPIHIAANKCDIAPEGALQNITTNGAIIPCMADVELALRRAQSAGLIDYISGQETFEILDKASLNEAQLKALSHMQERLKSNKGTGIATIIDKVLFDELDHIVVYPVQDELHWTDGDGKVLPDAFVVANAIQAKPLAYKVHSDLGDGFIKGVDGRTRRVVGAEHELSDGDVLKIHAKS